MTWRAFIVESALWVVAAVIAAVALCVLFTGCI